MIGQFSQCIHAGVAATSLIALAAPAYAQQADQRRYDLPAQPLGTSLRAVAAASGTNVLVSSALVDGKIAPALSGRFTPLEAVSALVRRSGLRVRLTGSDLIVDRTPPAQNNSAEAGGADIVVTGSRIRGAPIASPVITRTGDDLRDEGITDLGAAVRSIPQSYGGGQNPGIGINVPANRGVDVGGGASVNLRGLGSDATLTLLDGRRLAFTASSQSIDVSAIPLGAVERLEIVPDGASAIYGSDAVAGVANVILRRRFDGLEVSGRLGAATDGGDFQQQYGTTGGTQWTGGSVVGAYEYGGNTAITAGRRSYAAATRPGLTLFPALRHHSATIAGEQALTDTLTLDVDALYNKRWSDTTFPTVEGGDLRQGRASLSSQDRSYAIAPVLRLALRGDWRITVSGTLGEERVNYRQIECALDDCSVSGEGYYRNTERAADVGGDGKLVRLPGGDARIALGIGYRAIGFERFAVNGATVNTRHAQDSYFGYGELELPLIGPAQGVPMVDRLTATGAVRYERYPGLGGVATPKFGLIYAPTPDFDIKGSWGRSFRAPTLYQQYAPRTVVIYPPIFIGGTGLPANAGALLVIGGNPALRPERATTWSATLAFHPHALDGARIEFSYFDVNYRDRIVAPIAFLSQALSNPIFASQITRAPSAAAQAALIASAGTFLNIVPGPYNPANIVAIVDNGSVNAGRQSARGIDILAGYRMRLAADQSLKVLIDASYLDSAQQLSSSQPAVPLVGRIFSPPHWRGQGSLAWTARALTLASTVNYSGGVLDARTTTPVHIDGLTTVDLTARLQITSTMRALRGVELTLTAANLFNAKPSIIATSQPFDTPYDSTNYSPVGRLISVGISKTF